MARTEELYLQDGRYGPIWQLRKTDTEYSHVELTEQTAQVKKAKLRLGLTELLAKFDNHLTASEYDYYNSLIKELTE